MERYLNLDGKSGVLCYELGSDYIIVQFKDYGVYTYTYRSAGQYNVERMKELAIAGKGLNHYIMMYCKTLYASKVR